MNSLGCTKQPLTDQQQDRAGRMFLTVTRNKHRSRVQILDWIQNNLFKRRAQTRLSKKKWSASLFLLHRPSKMWPVQPPQCPAWSKQCLPKHIKQNGQYHAMAAKSCEQRWLPQDYHQWYNHKFLIDQNVTCRRCASRKSQARKQQGKMQEASTITIQDKSYAYFWAEAPK